MTLQKKQIAGAGITLIGGAFWGISGVVGQYLFEHKNVTANWLVPIRLLCAGMIMLLYFMSKDKKKALLVWSSKKNAIDLIIFALAGMMFCQYTYFITIERSNAGTATILQYLAPVMIMSLVCLGDKKLPTYAEVIAMLCALTGVFLVATHGNINHLVISKDALLYGILAAITVVIYNLQPRRLMKQFATPILLAWAMVIGGAALFIVFRPFRYSPVIDVQTILAMCFIIIFGTILSFTCYMQGVKLIGATHASLYASIEPLMATILSFVWLRVAFVWIDFIGFLFILSTIFILTLSSKDSKKEKMAE